MIVSMRPKSTENEVNGVLEKLESLGFQHHISRGVERTVIGVIGKIYPDLKDTLELMPGVVEVVRLSRPFKLSSREFHPDDTVVRVGDVTIGGAERVVMAGPCAVESREQLMETAQAVKEAGAHILRGGAYKPRTSPYSFRGLGEDGLEMLAEAREKTGLPIITEVMTPADVGLVSQYADILQIGARNMQNYILLDEVGKVDVPVMLKRGMSATIEEWLLAAEYVLAQGNQNLILCERGIRTFETYTRNTLDLSAIPVIKKLSHLPVIVDPSHATGKWYLVAPMALAAAAAGADGVMVEVHITPEDALCDGAQALTVDNFRLLMGQLSTIQKPLQQATL
ncbi:MAG: 3-deoxy-7-phosphoheptulonate synthase [Chloroflexi bacterium]|nr:3-deoxy-7-phosphoheptulonate synthase [Chloroflexota bacterium]